MQIKKRRIKEILSITTLIGIFVLIFLLFIYCFYNVFFPLKYTSYIKMYSNEYDLNPALVASIINAESKFNPNVVSKKGAIGLMQLMPSTALFIAQKNEIDFEDNSELNDIEKNIEIGIAYIDYLSNKFEDLYTMLCAYNAGEGNVGIWLKDPKYSKDGKKLNITPYRETNTYAKKVMRNFAIYDKRF